MDTLLENESGMYKVQKSVSKLSKERTGCERSKRRRGFRKVSMIPIHKVTISTTVPVCIVLLRLASVPGRSFQVDNQNAQVVGTEVTV